MANLINRADDREQNTAMDRVLSGQALTDAIKSTVRDGDLLSTREQWLTLQVDAGENITAQMLSMINQINGHRCATTNHTLAFFLIDHTEHL